MQTFITENFLLQTNTARKLYFDYVQHLPIIDYHNHLSPADIANNRNFNTITEAWLNGDHYKWRAMRANGIEENLITGNADDYAKFKAWAATVPYTMRNPLYHWTHLELKHPFNINELLNSETADKIYMQCNELLQTKFTVLEILRYHKVELLCTTDNPTDDLKFHKQFAKSDHSLKMLPTFRPDALLNFNERDEWLNQLMLLEQSAQVAISAPDHFLAVLENRIEYFHDHGCRLADHGLEYMPAYSTGKNDYENIFESLLQGKAVAQDDLQIFESLFFN